MLHDYLMRFSIAIDVCSLSHFDVVSQNAVSGLYTENYTKRELQYVYFKI